LDPVKWWAQDLGPRNPTKIGVSQVFQPKFPGNFNFFLGSGNFFGHTGFPEFNNAMWVPRGVLFHEKKRLFKKGVIGGIFQGGVPQKKVLPKP